jgi:hypothetical protein
MSSEDLFVSEQHPVSRRWAILEDDGTVAWLYLTEPDTQKPAADCWLYNRVKAPPTFSSELGQAPVAPATHVANDAAAEPPDERDVWFKWSSDGQSVAVHFDKDLVGFIAAKHRRGFSRNLSNEGPFGSPLNRDLYEQLFGAR